MTSNGQVVIIGGAMMGSSVAWWLSRDPAFGGRITVVERDPSYAGASTTHSNSCIRQQFGSEVNIQLSQFTAEFLKHFGDHMEAEAPQLPIRNFGYLYLAATETQADHLRQAQMLQHSLGAGTRLMSPEALSRDYPFYWLDDILLCSHNTVDEGYFDGGTVFDWFRNQARKAGVRFVQDEVTGIDLRGGQPCAVRCASGSTLPCDIVVNAAGPRAAQIMHMCGLDIPVEPRKRFTFVFDAADPLPCDLPLTIDPSGVHVRTDGRYYMAGCAPDDDHAVDPDDFTRDPEIWEDKVWPAIATRIPAFERIKLVNEWVGHYAYNRFDQNAIIGPHPDMKNLFLINGFSGHGLQQAPGVGRGVAELIAHGCFRTLDLSALSPDRLTRQQATLEHNVI